MGAESHDAAERGGAGILMAPQQLNDRLVERLAFVLIALTDMDAHEDALALQSVHRCTISNGYCTFKCPISVDRSKFSGVRSAGGSVTRPLSAVTVSRSTV